MLDRRQFLITVPALTALAPQALAQAGQGIRQVDIVHHSHLDVGYTDAPSVVRDKQVRFLDAAIDLCREDRNFRWTIEALLVADDWWRAASPARRADFQRALRSGQLDATALPLNQTAFQNARQWRQMLSWVPADLWRVLNPRVAMQSDVNGFPRAGAAALLDRGIHHLLMGINSDSGGPPFFRPSAFWWKMPDGRRLFTWLGEHYGRANAWLGAPRQGFAFDEKTVREAHSRFMAQIRKLESDGYPHDRLLLSFTNPAAYDNGWPYPTLTGFLETWNRLELQPALRLCTATQAMLEMEQKIGGQIPTLAGEWTDWWANGDASGPREVAASRFAKRYLAAAMSPAWGPLPSAEAPPVEGILKDLCLFDEHTWGASSSISAPYALRTLGQYVEKSELAYRPMGQAQWLLTRRSHAKIEQLADGVYIANPAPSPISGWVSLAGSGIPADRHSLVERKSGARLPISQSRVWIEKLEPHTILEFNAESIDVAEAPITVTPVVQVDAAGWPVSAAWPGMRKPLFEGAPGEFIAVTLVPPADRRTITQIHGMEDRAQRDALRQKSISRSDASGGRAQLTQTPHTLTYTQELRHARIAKGSRVLELWKREPRARLTVRFDRLSSTDPELFYIGFSLPSGTPLPQLSCGGMPFTPYRDQLEGSCRDYFAIDGWADYRSDDGHRLWVTRDAPLAAIGGPHALERHQAEPADTNRIVAMVFDNCWHTNFVADSHGAMEFQFELVFRESLDNPAELAEALTAEPVVVVNSQPRQSPAVLHRVL